MEDHVVFRKKRSVIVRKKSVAESNRALLEKEGYNEIQGEEASSVLLSMGLLQDEDIIEIASSIGVEIEEEGNEEE